MTEIDPKDSVQNEQFGNSEDIKEKKNSEQDADSLQDSKQYAVEKSTESNSDSANDELDSTLSVDNESIEDTVDSAPKETELTENTSNSDIVENESSDVQEPETDQDKKANDSIVPEEPSKKIDNVEKTVKSDSTKSGTINNESVSSNQNKETEDIDKKYPEEIDFTTKTKDELLDQLKIYLSEYPIKNIRTQVDAIKANFYKLHNAEIEELKTKFIENGGLEEDFKVEESPIEITVKELLNEYRDKRNELNKKLDNNKEENLKAKYEIIEAISELVNSQESLNKTFHDFRILQEKWRDIGAVPQSKVKDLWEKYHYHVEAFYDYIKINKELRDLDFKKNLEAKIEICEKSEELLLEHSVVEAFKQLQTLHDQWREIGPVPSDKRNEIWERFKDATSKINHKHQEYFVNLKEDQKKNLQNKTALCENAEELIAQVPENAKDWEENSKELIELQKIWKTIGFAPKKYNAKIYERFRAACDSFFNKKRDFFAVNREEQENHLQLKTELCIQAEALVESTDWKKTTNEFIRLQKKWKTIGSVPIKQSDKIWKRFRAACDTFFSNKSHYYANIDTTYNENLKAKETILEEIEAFKPSTDDTKNLNHLKDFQRRWSEIGFVPIKEKDSIQEKYRAVINSKFDELRLDEESKSLLKFRNKVESMETKPNSDKRLDMEREKVYNKIKQLESDIALWENNIGFFSNSKNAESLIADVEKKINDAKERIVTLQEKLNIIDEFE